MGTPQCQAGRSISYQATPAGPATPDGRQNTQQATQHCGHRYAEPARRTRSKHDTEPLCAARLVGVHPTGEGAVVSVWITEGGTKQVSTFARNNRERGEESGGPPDNPHCPRSPRILDRRGVQGARRISHWRTRTLGPANTVRIIGGEWLSGKGSGGPHTTFTQVCPRASLSGSSEVDM